MSDNQLLNLQHEQALLQWLNDLAEEGIFTTDANLRIVSWNHWLEIHTGFRSRDIIGRHLFEVYPQLKQRRLDRFYEQAIAGQVVLLSQRLHDYLLPISAGTAKDLTYMPQSAKIAPLIEAGEVVGTITAIENVTERAMRETQLQRQIEELERTETALRSSQNRLQYLLSSSPAIIYTCQVRDNYPTTFISENVKEQLGYSGEEFLADPNFWIAQVHPDDVAHLGEKIAPLREKGHACLEYRVRHQDGSYRWFRDDMKWVRHPNGKDEEIVGAMYDITERKRAEERVRQQAALLDIATDGILVKDLENRILFWNQSAQRLYGWTATEAMGRPAQELFNRDILPQIEQAWETVLEKGEWQGELPQITKYGKEIVVASRWSLVRDESDRPCSILAVNTDITEKKLLEAQFLRAQRMESIGTLASGIAHDLNNIFTPILGAVQLLQLNAASHKRDKLIEMLEMNVLRGADLVKQVLSFAKGLDGDRTLLQVKHLIDETIAIARETFPKSIKFSTQIDPDLWAIVGDATHLHQILMNLCVNARDAMPDGGTLSISAENIWLDKTSLSIHLDARVGPYIRLKISDTGTGIPADILDRIFEPFFTTKEVGKGTGLGLSTVQGIIKSHQGFINVVSEPGKGTEFQIYLPAVESSMPRESQSTECNGGHGECILVVDDEPTIRETTETLLEKYGYRVLTARDGIEAIASYSQHQNEIQVILLDSIMPTMDGPTTIQVLEKMNPQVKIITVSGFSNSLNCTPSNHPCVKAFLPKPYPTQDLLKILQQIIAKP